MLLIILALFWVVLLTPSVVRRIRERTSERSIQHFHAEHEVLSRQDYVVAPAHRLDRPDDQVARDYGAPRRPHLTVVHPEDTYRSIEARSSWAEWSRDYEYDEPGDEVIGHREEVSRATPTNHYARAYASHPDSVAIAADREVAPIRRYRSSRAQRRRIFLGLVALALLSTLGAVFVGSSLAIDATALTWFLVVAYVGLALYALSQGWVAAGSLGFARRARVAPIYRSNDDSVYAHEDYGDEVYEDGYDDSYGDPGWYGSGQGRRAFG